MATTSKKRKKAEPKEIVQAPAPKQHPECLTADHLLALETVSRDIDNARLLMSVEEQFSRNLKLELELIKIKLEKQFQLVQHKAAEYEAQKAKFKQFKKDLWPQYGFSEDAGLGYDPLSGRIVRQ